MWRPAIKNLVTSALCLALAWVLPFLTGQIPEVGAMLCPMHLPVLLCGAVCGWPWGMAVGLLAPVLRSFFFSMPPLYPTAVAMSFELAAYGAVFGLCRKLRPGALGALYLSLIAAMLAGRFVYGAARYGMLFLFETEFSFSMFLSAAFLQAWPGILLQLLLVPPLVRALERAGLSQRQLN